MLIRACLTGPVLAVAEGSLRIAGRGSATLPTLGGVLRPGRLDLLILFLLDSAAATRGLAVEGDSYKQAAWPAWVQRLPSPTHELEACRLRVDEMKLSLFLSDSGATPLSPDFHEAIHTRPHTPFRHQQSPDAVVHWQRVLEVEGF